MKLFHLSDLHIGRQLNGYSLRENQEVVLNQIIEAAKTHRPDVILLCGDIYDKTVPSAEACSVLDWFFKGLSQLNPKIPVLLIAGNHDSPERLAYAGSFLECSQIYVAAMPPQCESDHLKKVVLEDEYGSVNFYLLPFLKPGYVRHLFAEGVVTGYESAVKAVLERAQPDFQARNVLLSHQFYTAKNQELFTCESEQSVLMSGGLDQVDIAMVSDFDYVALGHLHREQRVGAEHIRYCGTPYKYSCSEEHHKKAIQVIELGAKGTPLQRWSIPLSGLQDVRTIRGTLEEILGQETAEKSHDFVSITVTDETEPYHLREQLSEVFDRILEIKMDNNRTRERLLHPSETVSVLRPLDAFRQFYETVCHLPMTEAQEAVMRSLVEQVKEEER